MPITDDKELLGAFIQESQDHLDGIEDDLLAIEEAGENIDEDLVNKVFRAVHSIKGGAGFLGLDTVKELAHNSENVMGKVRNKELIPTPAIISTLLDAIDTLSTLVNRYESSNEADISGNMNDLNAILAGEEEVKSETAASPTPTDIIFDREAISEDQQSGPISLPNGPLLKVEQKVFDTAFESGNHVYLVNHQTLFSTGNPEDNFKQVIEGLKQSGEIIAANIALDDTSPVERLKEAGELLLIVIATILEKDLLANFATIDPEQIQQITSEDIKHASAPPAQLTQQEQAPGSSPGVSKELAVQEKKETAPISTSSGKDKPAPKVEPKSESLRVNVRLLDTLMTLAGELVLTRNQLVQAVSSKKIMGVDTISQRLNLVTSELQEAIMNTRMQPVGTVFNKFKRIVRDLSQKLDKKINLIIEGEEVELDKTIIESIGDPLTHLIRNSVDHGIEMPEQRLASSKKEEGTLRLTAYHEGGQVMIAIEDDGAGINIDRVKEKVITMGLRDAAELEELSNKDVAKLIFLPGMSTAKEVSDVSGRGVGMDVVHTNISNVGGTVDIDTTPGVGSLITIKLPLTLAIIPSLIVTVQKERYAIPQVNMVELVRIPAAKVKERIETIGSAQVMRLRGELLPLIKLDDALGITERRYACDQTGENLVDRRSRIEDRRLDLPHQIDTEEKTARTSDQDNRTLADDRRKSPTSAYNILVVSAGDYHYGLIVDQLLDSEEIVVKPLGTHLLDFKCYAGASVQGDGRVALILDIVGISNIMKLRTVSKSVQEQVLQKSNEEILHDLQALLIVRNVPDEQIAIPLDLISRIELSKTANIEITGGRRNIQYRGSTLPLFSIDEVAKVGVLDPTNQSCYIIVFSIGGKEVGIIMSEIIDIVRGDFTIDELTHKQPGIMGSAIINDEITLLVDLFGVIDTLMPEWTKSLKLKAEETGTTTILVVEDSPFFQNQVVTFLNEVGYETFTADDGIEGLEVLAKERIDLVVTDIEMPNMDGLEMCKRIRADKNFTDLPIIAVTSLAGDSAEKKGKEVGINEYLVKLDREKIIAAINKLLN